MILNVQTPSMFQKTPDAEMPNVASSQQFFLGDVFQKFVLDAQTDSDVKGGAIAAATDTDATHADVIETDEDNSSDEFVKSDSNAVEFEDDFSLAWLQGVKMDEAHQPMAKVNDFGPQLNTSIAEAEGALPAERHAKSQFSEMRMSGVNDRPIGEKFIANIQKGADVMAQRSYAPIDPDGQLIHTERQGGWIDLNALRLSNVETTNAIQQLPKTVIDNTISNIAVQIRSANSQTIEITLHPAELGKLNIHLHQDKGSILAVISADRAETQDLLRRHVDQLEADLIQSGFSDVGFEFKEQSDQNQKPEQGLETMEFNEILSLKQNNPPLLSLKMSAGMDIRV